MSTRQIIAKLNAYKKNPEVFQSLSNQELADLVVFVLQSVKTIEDAIQTKKIDLDTKFSTKTDQAIKQMERDHASLLKEVTKQVNALLIQGDTILNETAGELQKRVQDAIANIRDGKDGIVTEVEIQHAAEVALSMLELPDFDALVTENITSNGQAIRDALELLSGEDRYKVEIADVQGLRDMLESLAQIRSVSGGTIGKQQVYGFIRQAIADGIITTGGASSFLDLTDTPSSYAGQAGKVVAVNGTEDGLEYIAASGVGTVTSVAVSGSDGIEVDSGSPITTAGTIALGLNKTTTLTFLNVEDGAEVNNISDANATDLTDGGDTTLHTHDGRYYTETEMDTFLGLKQDESVVISSNQTAANDQYYVNVASATYTDPSPVEGKGFVVFVRNGTATVGGTGYGTAGTLVYRIFHSGAWANYEYQVSSTFLTASNISDTTYGVGWNGDTTTAPSKNAIYDQIELLAPKASPTFTGNATFDTNTLFVDATNDRVGVGTATPTSKLDVQTTAGVGVTLNEFSAGNPSFNTYSSGTGYLYFRPKDEYTVFTPSGSVNSTMQIQNGGAGYSQVRLFGSSDNRIITNAGNLTITPAGNTIFSSGAVGVGTTTPYAPVTIRATNAGAYAEGMNFDINDATTNSAIGIDWNLSNTDLGVTNPGARIQGIRVATGAGGALAFSTRNGGTSLLNEAMRISQNGNVGIGDTNPSNKLSVTGDGSFTGAVTVSRLNYARGIATVSALGNLGATETFDWSTATNFTGNLDSNITIDFSNAVSGQTITLYLAYSGALRTLSWTPTIEWGGGTAPVGPDEAGEHLVVTLKYIGTTYFGSFELFK